MQRYNKQRGYPKVCFELSDIPLKPYRFGNFYYYCGKMWFLSVWAVKRVDKRIIFVYDSCDLKFRGVL